MAKTGSFSLFLLVLLLCCCSGDSRTPDASPHADGAPDSAKDPDADLPATDLDGEVPRADTTPDNGTAPLEDGPGQADAALVDLHGPGHAFCAYPKVIDLFTGPVTVSADSSGLLDEFNGAITCGSSSTVYKGPQLYYEVSIPTGHALKLTLTPSFTAHLIVFTSAAACQPQDINASCSSGSGTGAKFTSVSPGLTRRMYFWPATGGTFIVAVDSTDPAQGGAFNLVLETVTAAPNGTCATAQPLTLGSGPTYVSGNTGQAQNEFGSSIDCGAAAGMLAPQLYYRVTLPPDQGLSLTLQPDFYAYLVLFPDAAGCNAADINAACGSSGASGAKLGAVNKGSSASFTFWPSAPGDYIIAVDSTFADDLGQFALTLELIEPAANATCASPQPVTLGSGPTLIQGDTSLSTNEFGTSITCQGFISLDGPQLYYRVSLTDTSRVLAVALTPSFSTAYLYIVPPSTPCTAAAINLACGGGGGAKLGSINAGATGMLSFQPTSVGDHLVVVDSAGTTYQGTFELSLELQ